MLTPKSIPFTGTWTIIYTGKGGSVPSELLTTTYSSARTAQVAIDNYTTAKELAKKAKPVKQKESE